MCVCDAYESRASCQHRSALTAPQGPGAVSDAAGGGREEGSALDEGEEPGVGESGGGVAEDHHAPGGSLQPEGRPAG